jgi:hypothetical protein
MHVLWRQVRTREPAAPARGARALAVTGAVPQVQPARLSLRPVAGGHGHGATGTSQTRLCCVLALPMLACMPVSIAARVVWGITCTNLWPSEGRVCCVTG